MTEVEQLQTELAQLRRRRTQLIESEDVCSHEAWGLTWEIAKVSSQLHEALRKENRDKSR